MNQQFEFSRQIGWDVDTLVNARNTYVQSLKPQIVIPNQAWMGQVSLQQPLPPLVSTDPRNAWSRQIVPDHSFRSKQLFYGN